jgi:signal transduction histidine kinase
MSATPHYLIRSQPQDVLGELLHSLCQPLTSLRCSLELSIDEAAEQQQNAVAVALQETDRAIGIIQLMREYLDAEQRGSGIHAAAFAPAIRSVIEELSSIASVRGVRLRLAGTCAATLKLPEAQLRLALQYLFMTIVEGQPAGGRVVFLMGEGPAGAVLRVEGGREFRGVRSRQNEMSAIRSPLKLSAPQSTGTPLPPLRWVRLAIASRVIETAGAMLVLRDGDHSEAGPVGFVLRVPGRADPPVR